MITTEGVYLSAEQLAYFFGLVVPAMISIIGLGILWMLERFGRV